MKTSIVIMWIVVLVAPWINHIVYCFKSKEYVLLIAGAFIAPVGWFHGLGLWLGFW